jgi:hypothetical protein
MSRKIHDRSDRKWMLGSRKKRIFPNYIGYLSVFKARQAVGIRILAARQLIVAGGDGGATHEKS